MKQWESEALVLRIRPYGESDKLVTLLTHKEGRVGALARGARKTKSKLSAGVDLFNRGEYLLYRGRSLATIQQVSLLENFVEMREDITLYFTGLYICELLEKILEENHPVEEIYRLTLETFYTLSKGKSACDSRQGDRDLSVRSFELLLLKELGYSPYLKGCVNCGVTNTPFLFSASAGGLLCKNCGRGAKGVHLSPGSIALMERILKRGLSGTRVVRVPPGMLKELSQATFTALTHNTGIKNIKSKACLDNLPQGKA